jgi:hypothetical protein
VPVVERFEVAAEELRRRLAALDPPGAGPGRRAGRRGADAGLAPPPGAARLLGRVQALGAAAGLAPTTGCWCHGDLIGDNLLVDRAGRLWVVDWDGARWGPRELDLALFTGPGFGRFLAAYEADAGPPASTRTWRRSSCCGATSTTWPDWLGAALDGDRPEPQRRADLDGVGWCLSRWPELETRIDHTCRCWPAGAGPPDGQPRRLGWQVPVPPVYPRHR